MINVDKSIARLKKICEEKGVAFFQVANIVKVSACSGDFTIKVCSDYVEIGTDVPSIDPRDVWIYFDWPVTE